MKYVALLRGINIGGRNKIDMKHLVRAMETAGFKQVSTYINSGNIFFEDPRQPAELRADLEAVIKSEFGLEIRALLRNKDDISRIAAALPKEWRNDGEMKCDILFLDSECDDKGILARLPIKAEIDEVRYLKGALLWRVDRQDATRSGMMKIPGMDLYAQMTIRNCNTVRKLAERLL